MSEEVFKKVVAAIWIAAKENLDISIASDGAAEDLARAVLDAMPGWQPIDTAPKDGTPIIGGFHSIRWADSHRKDDIVRCWWQPEFEAFVSSCREMCLHNGHTFEDGSTRQLHSPVKEPVTHWMTIPTPPEA